MAATGTRQQREAHEATGRLGLLGHGVYHLLLTLLCARLLLGSGGGDTGAQGAIATVARQPFGQVLLAGLTLAFGAYAAIRWIRVVRGEGGGDDESSAADRAKNALRGTVWTVLTVLAGTTLLRGLRSGGSGGGGGDSGTSLTRAVLEAPGGQWLVAAIGLGLAGVAAYQLSRANGGLDDELHDLGLQERRVARWLGRAGYLGRALAYGLVSLFVVHAAVTHDPSAGRGLDGALEQARTTSWGPWLLLAVTLGFLAFGLFRLVEARYARDVT